MGGRSSRPSWKTRFAKWCSSMGDECEPSPETVAADGRVRPPRISLVLSIEFQLSEMIVAGPAGSVPVERELARVR